MALTKIQKTGVGADAIDATKIADNAIETAQIKADAVNATKIADDSISEEHLDPTAIIGNTELSEGAAAGDILLIYDTSAGTLKKILASNVGTQVVTLTSVSPTNVVSGDGTGNYTFTITGTNLTGGSAELVNTTGTILNFDSVTVNSSTQITGVIAKSSLLNSGEPYDVRVLGSNGAQATKRDQINVDASPVFVTASGSLGASVLIGNAGSFSVNATDPESAGNVTFELQSGSLPPSYTITNTAAEGGTAIIAGTDSTTSSTTTFNFVLRAVDAASNTTSRAFSITSRVLVSQSFTASGTFSVPAGITSSDVLVVAGGGSGGCQHGGGGGGGGLVYFPSYPLTASGTLTVTVGNGGVSAGGPRPSGSMPTHTGQDSVLGNPSDPGLGQGGILTAKGGGYGSSGPENPFYGGPGGSGGGGGYGSPGAPGQGIQPTQSGNSGAYGFGNNGGAKSTNPNASGGGGGGAGGNGNGGLPSSNGYPGGVGRAYTIADGTSSVYYAGGGGGGAHNPSAGGQGGQGGGGDGGVYGSPTSAAINFGQNGTANRGGGGGGNGRGLGQAAGPLNVVSQGGKGIVIIRY